jgi:putative ABC transport system permease protein
MAGPFNWLSQAASVTKFGLLTIPQRRGAVAAAVFGIAGVVAVLVGVLSIGQGFRRAMTVSGSPATALVLRGGSDSEMVSGLSREDTRVVADSTGVARGPDGPLASAELFVIINLPKRSTGTDANVPLRGVEAAAFQVRDNVRIVQGRMIEWGRNEVVVGAGAAAEFAGLDVGGKLQVGRNEWQVVGVFGAGGGIAESEIWTDAKVLQAAYNRGDSFQSVYAKLTSAGAFDTFKDALTTNPRLNVKVLRQSEYYADQSTAVTRLITSLGVLIAALMAVGAVFGALNTMYSAVSARRREIATLRALGFGGGPVVVSVMFEALLLALAGGGVGGGLAYLAFDGFHTATMNWQSFSQVTFAFAVTPQLLAGGILLAVMIGLAGGLLPAIRAARLPIASALREL